jgi:hypothetical protein
MPLSVIIGLLCVAGGIALLAAWAALRPRWTPEKRERRRRLDLHTHGRLGDALLTEVHGDTLYYTYTVRGVHYAASQDIGSLRDRLPGEPERLGGMVAMKYSGQNPANSILICEEWSGLRLPPPKSRDASDSPVNSAVSANRDAVGHQPQDPAMAQGSQG